MAEHYSRHKAAFSPGACLKQYSVEQVLGVGGFGITYLAIDGDLQTQVAIKEYLPNDLVVREGDEVLPKSPESQNAFQWGLSRFLQEGRELAKFRHANIVRVHQMFEANNTAYMVLDYENGDTMEKWLRGLARKPTEGELRDILIPLLGALEHIHQGGLLHRDISPDNIIIRKNGAPVLLDFGSARYATAAESKTLSALIKAGYSPPEQYSARGRQGAYTDIYALAATLYRAITGEKPPEGSWRVAEVAGGDGDPLPPLQEAGYSADFLSAIEKALAVSAGNRPQRIAEWRKMFNFSAGAEAQTEFAQQPTQETQSTKSSDSGSDSFFDDKNVAGESDKQNDSASFSEPQDANAQYKIGENYYYGNGVEQNDQKAMEWLRKAAVQGHAPAQFKLGGMYKDGRGINQNVKEAAKWFLKAAEQGNSEAQEAVVALSFYEYGMEMPKNWRNVKKTYMQKFAEQGDILAQYELGHMYQIGDGVEKNYQEAAKWFLKAADQGNVAAWVRLCRMMADNVLTRKMRKTIKEWYVKTAEQGDDEIQRQLATMYEMGWGISKSYQEAEKWYLESVKRGNLYAQKSLDDMRVKRQKTRARLVKFLILPFLFLALIVYVYTSDTQKEANAHYELGLKYYYGEGVEKNYQEAVKWWRMSAEQGHALAQSMLGWIYQSGQGVKQNYQESAKWYRKSAEQGNAFAQHTLGWMYRVGRGVKQNKQESAKWHQKADAPRSSGELIKRNELFHRAHLRRAEKGDASAQNSLGSFYQVQKQDDQEAAKWYLKSAQQGNASAQFNYGEMYENGWGVEQDRQEAIKWYQKAAEQGHDLAKERIDLLR